MTKDLAATTTLSLRLMPEERRLIEDAAEQKGWKAANFLRISALERAAQILNLSRPNSFDFSGAAKRVAEVLIAPRRVTLVDKYLEEEDLQGQPFGPFGEGPIGIPGGDKVVLDQMLLRDFTPAPLTPEQVDTFRNAIRLGGPEFMAEVIVECRRLGGLANDPGLPPPIDPHNIKNS